MIKTMFGNLIFLIIALLVISLAPESNGKLWVASPKIAFLTGMALYGLTLGLISLEAKWRQKRQLMLTVANIELIGFLTAYHFLLAGHRLFPESTTIISLFSLTLYFFGLAFFHFHSWRTQSYQTKKEHPHPWGFAMAQVRLLIPFIIPFSLFVFLADISTYSTTPQFIENHSDSYEWFLILLVLSSLFLIALMIFIPGLIQIIWNCKPIEDQKLQKKLENLCLRADFKHAGMKTWTIMNHALTAGIIGIIPKFRYVMFTNRLLKEMTHDQIEAILAHEIAHSKKKHLLIYPCIIFGMLITAALFSLFFSEAITEFLALINLRLPSPFWEILEPFAIFIPYAVIIALYIRFVFGYFSRLFERQADLNVFELGVPYYYMLQALDSIGKATGNTHRQPNWHHYGIQERINYLCKAAMNPELICRHHRRVKKNVFIYFVFLFSFLALLVIPIRPIDEGMTEASSAISDFATKPIRKFLAEQAIQKYRLSGNLTVITKALMESYTYYASTRYSGIPEFAAASLLYDEREYKAAALLMDAAWKNLDPELKDHEILNNFRNLSKKLSNVN